MLCRTKCQQRRRQCKAVLHIASCSDARWHHHRRCRRPCCCPWRTSTLLHHNSNQQQQYLGCPVSQQRNWELHGKILVQQRHLTSTVASTSPRTAVEPILHESPLYMVTGRDSPVRADWSTSRRPSFRRQSAGIAEPAPSSTISPGTSILASMFCQLPSRLTVAVGLREALRAATASAALMVSYLCAGTSDGSKKHEGAAVPHRYPGQQRTTVTCVGFCLINTGCLA